MSCVAGKNQGVAKAEAVHFWGAGLGYGVG
jgi:hypothetical protein